METDSPLLAIGSQSRFKGQLVAVWWWWADLLDDRIDLHTNKQTNIITIKVSFLQIRRVKRGSLNKEVAQLLFNYVHLLTNFKSSIVVNCRK